MPQFAQIPAVKYVSENLGANFINISDNMSIGYKTDDGRSFQLGWITDVSNKDAHAFAMFLNPKYSDLFVKMACNNQFGNVGVSASMAGRVGDGLKGMFGSLALEYDKSKISVGMQNDVNTGVGMWATFVQEFNKDMKLTATYAKVKNDNTFVVALDKDNSLQVYLGAEWNSSVSRTPEQHTTITMSSPTIFGGVTTTFGGRTGK